jgi:ubiquinone/menaquinone biosynthesis C-methylase UbiE
MPSSTCDELPVREGYAFWASSYDEDGNPLIALEEPAVRDWFGPLRGRQAIDIGCGTGRHTRALVEAGAIVAALDFCPEMMARARAKVSGRDVAWIHHALPARLPFADAVFDLAVLGLVAEHVQDLARALGEVARVLKPGARCIVSALHPDRTAAGERARFIDPVTGKRRPIATIHRTVDQYLAEASASGLALVEERALIVPEELAERLPRARRYVGLPLGWVGCWMREHSSG